VVQGCTEGAKALEVAKALRPALILQDLTMPDADGMQLIRAYRGDAALAGTPVLVLSGRDDAETKARAFEAGADDYVVKMPPAAEMAARIRHLVRVHRAEAERARAALEVARSELELRALNEANVQLLEQERAHLATFDRLTRLLNEVTDLDIMLRRLLSEARALLGCEAGSILLHRDDHLVFTYAQNDVLNMVTRFPDLRRSPVWLPIDRSSIAGAGAVDGMVVVQDAYAIPASAPFHFNRSFDERTGYRTRAVLAVALHDSQGRLLGVMQLINPRPVGAHHSVDFTEDDQKMARQFANLAAVGLERSQKQATWIERLMKTAEMRDPKETGAHVKRVAEVSARLFTHWATAHGLSREELDLKLDLLRPAAKLHDLGKVGIQDSILKAERRLTDDERAVMQTHPVIGAETLDHLESALDDAIAEVILYHQAKWDGTGYPSRDAIVHVMNQLGRPADRVGDPKGESIPLFARCVAMADVFDALMSKRAYKDPWPPEKVRDTIAHDAGTHFDPELAGLFVAHFDEMCEAHQMFTEEEAADAHR
jgi:response regulator RpfG family c-di-GMP phosphodiesterase